jgi:hypothetical protein
MRPFKIVTCQRSICCPAGKRRLGSVSLQAAHEAAAANRAWLQECVALLLCVLCLDRFGDYVSDQACTPVQGS